jgi:hypothetical protein
VTSAELLADFLRTEQDQLVPAEWLADRQI